MHTPGAERDQNLALFRTRHMPSQPLIARHHYFQTGTLRYFETVHASRTALRPELTYDLGEADGHLSHSSATNLDAIGFFGYSGVDCGRFLDGRDHS